MTLKNPPPQIKCPRDLGRKYADKWYMPLKEMKNLINAYAAGYRQALKDNNKRMGR